MFVHLQQDATKYDRKEKNNCIKECDGHAWYKFIISLVFIDGNDTVKIVIKTFLQ